MTKSSETRTQKTGKICQRYNVTKKKEEIAGST